ncbi:MAG: hypothetical protein AB1776_08850 [Bacillota bacterium]
MGKVPTKTIFVLFLVVLAFLAVQDFALRGADGVFGDYLRRVFDEEARDFRGWENMPHRARTGAVTRAAGGIKVVRFPHPGGRVELRRGEVNQIRVGYEIVVYADRPEQAARYLSRVDVQQVVDGGLLTFRLQEPRVRDEGVRSVRVNYTAALPAGLLTEVTGSEGVTARGLTGSLVVEGGGPVTVAGVTGDIKIDGCPGLEITGVKGNVWVRAFAQDGYIAGVDGNLTLDNRNGDVIVENLRGDLEAKFDGRLLVNGVAGTVRVEGRGGLFDAAHIDGPVTVNGRELLVNLRDIRGDTRVTAAGRSNVLCELPAGREGCRVTALSRGGRIVTNLPLTLVETGAGEQKATGRVGNGRYRVDIATEASNIYLRSPQGK